MKCFNCACIQTPLWRRGPGGEQLCNACGIYYKNHGTHRSMPVKMKSMVKKAGGAGGVASRGGVEGKKKRKPRVKVQPVDAFDFASGQDSEVFAAHVLIKLSYDVYMMTPQSHHNVPTVRTTHTHTHTPAHVRTAAGVSSPYGESHTPPQTITAGIS